MFEWRDPKPRPSTILRWPVEFVSPNVDNDSCSRGEISMSPAFVPSANLYRRKSYSTVYRATNRVLELVLLTLDRLACNLFCPHLSRLARPCMNCIDAAAPCSVCLKRSESG